MSNKIKLKFFIWVGFIIFLTAVAPTMNKAAYADDALSVKYYTASGKDFGDGMNWGNFNDEVSTNLGPNGLPVLNPTYANNIYDVSPTTGEILWWSPSLSLPSTTI